MGVNLGIVAGGAAAGFIAQQENARRNAEEARRQEEYEQKKEYDQKLKEISAPATVETKEGLQLRHKDSGQTFFAPVEQAKGLTAAPDSPYEVTKGSAEAPVKYHSVDRGLGNSFTSDDSLAAIKAADEHAAGLNKRQAALALQYARPADALAFQEVGRGGLKDRLLGSQVASAELTQKQHETANQIMTEHRAIMADPAKKAAYAAKLYGDPNVGGWTEEGEHKGATAEIKPAPGGGYVARQFGPDGKEMKQHFITEDQMDAQLSHHLAGQLAATSPELAMHYADKLTQREQFAVTKKLEERKIDIDKAYKEATTENQKQHFANELKKIDAQTSYMKSMIGVKQAGGTPVGVTDDEKSLIIMGHDGKVSTQPLPEGTAHLFKKFTGDAADKAAKAFPDSTITAFTNKYMEAPAADRRRLVMDNPSLAKAAGFGTGADFGDVKPKGDKTPAAAPAKPVGLAPPVAPPRDLGRLANPRARELYMNIQAAQPGGALAGTSPEKIDEWKLELSTVGQDQPTGGFATGFPLTRRP